MKAVFLDKQTFSDNINFDAISSAVDSFESYPLTAPEEVIEHCVDADIIITNKVLMTADIIAKLPKLKLICVAATGTNNIDFAAADKHNVKVMNVAGYSTTSVAQYVFAQLLEFFGETSVNNTTTEQGKWQQSPTFCIHSPRFDELAGKTLGIIGYGDIGQKVAAIATAFDMQILIAERPNSAEIRNGRVSFNEMLAQSDIVSAHCPLTPETDKLFSTDAFNQMKSDAVLVNTARGGVVDSEALYQALTSKQIGGAILDVLEQEPPPADHILLQTPLENLKITAHIAWASTQSQQRLINLIAENIKEFKKQI